ncbi:MAG: vWA domain-containing protein [Planctomycetota bacterium]
MILAVDDSESMQHDGKCFAAAEAVKEMVYRMKLREQTSSAAFDIAIFSFGHAVRSIDHLMLRPVAEVDEDVYSFQGKSGGTRIYNALGEVCALLYAYQLGYYDLHEAPETVPPPLVIMLSDGCDRDSEHDPVAVAQKITSTDLPIGLPPLVVTVGVEFTDRLLNDTLLKQMASKTDDGTPLYLDIGEADQLADCLATVGSSAATTANTLYAMISHLTQTTSTPPEPSS